jgi:hypothetical protein
MLGYGSISPGMAIETRMRANPEPIVEHFNNFMGNPDVYLTFYIFIGKLV